MAPAAFGTWDSSWDTGELLLVQAKLPSKAPEAAGRLLSRSTVRSVTGQQYQTSIVQQPSGRRTFRLPQDLACAKFEEHRQVAIYPVRYFTTSTSRRVKRDKDSVRSFEIPTEVAPCDLLDFGLWILDFRFWNNDVAVTVRSHPVFFASTPLSPKRKRISRSSKSLNRLA